MQPATAGVSPLQDRRAGDWLAHLDSWLSTVESSTDSVPAEATGGGGRVAGVRGGEGQKEGEEGGEGEGKGATSRTGVRVQFSSLHLKALVHTAVTTGLLGRSEAASEGIHGQWDRHYPPSAPD